MISYLLEFKNAIRVALIKELTKRAVNGIGNAVLQKTKDLGKKYKNKLKKQKND
jgi:hypothetical protein